MDRFWIKKLQELQERLHAHKARKELFNSLPDRTTLTALREGQRLKEQEDQIRDHYAQLAEFATGIPADKFNFRLDFKKAYEIDLDGKLTFGPSALKDEYPYILFDVQKLFGEQIEPADGPVEEIPESVGPDELTFGSLEFAKDVIKRRDESRMKAVDESRMSFIKPADFGLKLSSFITRASAFESYIEAITAKYMPAQISQAGPSQFFIYEGNFVYLSRKGGWTSMRRTVLSQVDYFADMPIPERAERRLTVSQPETVELEPEQAADYITRDLTQPVSSAGQTTTMGFFTPTRRVGVTSAPDIGRKPVYGAPMQILGSPEFAEEMVEQAEEIGKPVQEITPAFISQSMTRVQKAQALMKQVKQRKLTRHVRPSEKVDSAMITALNQIILSEQRRFVPDKPVEVYQDDYAQTVRAYTDAFRQIRRLEQKAGAGPLITAAEIAFPKHEMLELVSRYVPEYLMPEQPQMEVFRRSADIYEEPQYLKPEMKRPEQISYTESKIETSTEKSAAFKVVKKLLQSLKPTVSEKALPSEISLPPEVAHLIHPAPIAARVIQKFEIFTAPEEQPERFKVSPRMRRVQLLKPGGVGSRFEQIGIEQELKAVSLKSKELDPSHAEMLKYITTTPQPEEHKQQIQWFREMLQKGESADRRLVVNWYRDMLAKGKSVKGAQIISWYKEMIQKGGPGHARTMLMALKSSIESARIAPWGYAGLTYGRNDKEQIESAKLALEHLLGSHETRMERTVSRIFGHLPRADEIINKVARGVETMASRMGLPRKAGMSIARVVHEIGIRKSPQEQLHILAGKPLKPAPEVEPAAILRPIQIGSYTGMMVDKLHGIGSVGQKSDELSKTLARVPAPVEGALREALEDIGPPLKLGALPALGGITVDREGADSTFTDMSSTVAMYGPLFSPVGGAKLPIKSMADRDLPRGWDRPPFEVGEAIKRHMPLAAPHETRQVTGKQESRLADYGLSVIDLEDKTAEAVSSPLSEQQTAREIDIDEDTVDQIYFRLKRIMETETERMGDEA